MAFIRIPGVVGKVHVPDQAGPKKHNCKDCFFCQWCGDERCRTCLKQKGKTPKNACCKKMKKSNEYENFDRIMHNLMKVPHSEIKAALDAEKVSKQKKVKTKTEKKNG